MRYDNEFGIAHEKTVREWLASLGYPSTNSTTEENILDDIDCYVHSPKGKTWSVSIKSYTPRYRFGKFNFELRGLTLDKRNRKLPPTWQPRWFVNGKADWYVIYRTAKGDSTEQLWLLNKKAILNYVEDHGWDERKGLSQPVKDEQLRKGFDQLDSDLGFLTEDTIINNRLGYVFAERQPPAKPFKRINFDRR